MALTNINAAVAWTQQNVNTAQNGRFHIGAIFPAAAATTGLTAWRDGVVTSTNQAGANNIPGDLIVKAISPTPSLSLTVEAGHMIITRAGQGPFLGYLGTQSTLTLAGADPTNPRIDRIVAQIYDTTIGDSLAGLSPLPSSPGCVVIRAVTGAPAGSPVAPTLAAGQISLANIAVAANSTAITNAMITDNRRSAWTPSGARVMLPGDATGDAGAVTGELRHTVTTTFPDTRTWSGTAWKPLAVPVYTSTALRNADLGAGGQYDGQQAVVDNMLTSAYGGAWFNTYPIKGAPVAKLRQATLQTLTNGTFAAVTFDAEDADNYNGHTTGGSNDRYTVPLAGYYLISGSVSFAANVTGPRAVEVTVNGTALAGSDNNANAVTGGNVTRMSARPLVALLAVNDIVRLSAFQGSGGNLDTNVGSGAEFQSQMSIVWVAGA